MADPELVSVKWLYYLGGAIVTLCSVIAGMAKWFAAKREEIANQYKNLMIELNDNLDRIGDYLKEIYNREADTPKERTEFDFKLRNGVVKKKK
jgi:hypothetical protein